MRQQKRLSSLTGWALAFEAAQACTQLLQLFQQVQRERCARGIDAKFLLQGARDPDTAQADDLKTPNCGPRAAGIENALVDHVDDIFPGKFTGTAQLLKAYLRFVFEQLTDHLIRFFAFHNGLNSQLAAWIEFDCLLEGTVCFFFGLCAGGR